MNRNDESGAVIILALVFLVAVSLIVTGLLTWVGASLNATGSFQIERNVEYAATDAVNLAIQNTRYTFDAGSPNKFLNSATPESCASYSIPGQANSVDVYCSMVWQPYSADTRVFTYSACTTNSANNAKATDCTANPLLQVIVAFDDYPSGIASPSPTPSECTPILQQGNPPSGPENGSCGQSMTQLSWQWNPVVPAITALSPSTGSTNGGATVTIQGTGFTSGETVNFVEQPQELPVPTGTYNPPVSATVLAPSGSCALPTCIQMTSPAVTIGNAYFVTVTTPGGTSQTASSDYNSFVPTFTYSPVAPTVTGLTGTTAGSITGNTLVTIQGTGFWSAPNNTFPAQAFFCTSLAGTTCLSGPVVSVTAPPSGSTTFTMDALTPAVSAAGTYYVEVEVYHQYSALTTNAEFTYSVQAPLVISLSTSPATNPTSGPAGTSLTIAGANFLTNSTVGFCAETNGTPTVGSCPTTTSQQTMGTITSLTATQIIVSVPTLSTAGAGTYYPIVTLPSAYSSTPPSQPYNEPADIFTYT